MENNLKETIKNIRSSFEEKKLNQEYLAKIYKRYSKIKNSKLFVKRALKQFPKLNCGLASVYIREKIKKGKIINGKFKGENHTFILINRNKIIDITSDQYKGPKIYIGAIKSPYKLTNKI